MARRDEANERHGYANGQHDVYGQHRLDGNRVEPGIVVQQRLGIDVLLVVDVLVRASVDGFLRFDDCHLDRDQ